MVYHHNRRKARMKGQGGGGSPFTFPLFSTHSSNDIESCREFSPNVAFQNSARETTLCNGITLTMNLLLFSPSELTAARRVSLQQPRECQYVNSKRRSGWTVPAELNETGQSM